LVLACGIFNIAIYLLVAAFAAKVAEPALRQNDTLF